MNIRAIHIIFIWLVILPMQIDAQQDSLQFSLLRQYDTWQSYVPTNNNSAYEKVKNFGLLGGSASIGGSARAQFELLDQPLFQPTDQDNTGILTRGLFHLDVRDRKAFQFFFELGSSHSITKDNPSVLDRDRLYVNQLFFKFRTGHFNWTIGRENLNYGSRRLFAIREGPNVRLSFDTFRAAYGKNNFSSELLALSLVPIERGVFHNGFYQFNDYVLGSYNTLKLFSDTTLLELYYFRVRQEFSTYVAVQGNEVRHSLGTRMEIPWGPLRFNHEFVYQFGNVATQNVSAWTLSLKTVYKISESLEYEINAELISGDNDQGDDRLNTFNPLYPDVAYFGRAARFAPYNLIDLHNSFQYRKNNWMLDLGHYAFWRYSLEDGIYGSGGFLLFQPVNNERFVAQQLAFTVKYHWNKFLATDLETNIILPENFIQEQDGNSTLSFLLFTTTFTF